MSIAAQVLMMILAALFEVGGDALIRRGITGGGIALIAVGFVVLGTYGVVVNLIGLDFSRLLGAYVGWFAVVSVLFGRIVFGDRFTISMGVGLGLVLAGSLVIQTGSRFGALPVSEVAGKTVR
jgi:small multidrug resistance family-3 protein